VILPHGYFIVWLDEDGGQGPEHANFKLSNSGEFIMLSDGASVVYDSLTFGQQLPDISFGRYPNGTGSFTFMPTTFDAQNSLSSGTTVVENQATVRVFPNPAQDRIQVRSEASLGVLRLFDALGRMVGTLDPDGSTSAELEVDRLSTGLYFLKIGQVTVCPVVIQR
jgi:hypothetical protein